MLERVLISSVTECQNLSNYTKGQAMKSDVNLMQVKQVQVRLIALLRVRSSSGRSEQCFLFALGFCWCSVDSRGHVTDGKTKSYHRCFFNGSFVII